MDKKSFNVAAAGILGACASAGSLGAPGGVMYAGLMANGYTLADFEQITHAMRAVDLIRKRGECYTITPKGLELNAKIDAALSQQRAAA